eukprot:CAMPEP_0175060778 /NCGR_PEP_ID=MMETSP0052_2-20121109/13219_1 /TAXON_ID=51329 ORGANISM="Polytomella parva, Strain SAG 63-3" /NCGR_SAMPLE_ID=MMETSP0052_2 /ASSEMBLY_ACC=CAM_ASM_000194 /LENGTH=228 /DNA_ID=CAMNT_0016326561 /DNA_START=105 /DNA_END=787 /DNA_ORIENTATION=-
MQSHIPNLSNQQQQQRAQIQSHFGGQPIMELTGSGAYMDPSHGQMGSNSSAMLSMGMNASNSVQAQGQALMQGSMGHHLGLPSNSNMQIQNMQMSAAGAVSGGSLIVGGTSQSMYGTQGPGGVSAISHPQHVHSQQQQQQQQQQHLQNQHLQLLQQQQQQQQQQSQQQTGMPQRGGTMYGIPNAPNVMYNTSHTGGMTNNPNMPSLNGSQSLQMSGAHASMPRQSASS